MTLLQHHDPPSYLPDLDRIPGGRAQWHRYIRRTLSDAEDNLKDILHTLSPNADFDARFFDPCEISPGGYQIQVPIRWNAFPRRLLCRFGREKALTAADMLWPLTKGGDVDPCPAEAQRADDAGFTKRWMRQQDEYCEWRVERDPLTQRIQRVIFTVESPEYWMALHGGELPQLRDGGNSMSAFKFKGDPRLAAELYSDLLGRSVPLSELLGDGGHYDLHNAWNTTRGIVHLTQPSNFLNTQVRLIADSTIGVCRDNKHKQSITDPLALVCARGFGNPNRNSDPAIAGSVNALVRSGAWVTLDNPVGIYIDDVNTSGWSFPPSPGHRRFEPRECLHVARGMPDKVLRLVVETPADSGLQLGQMRIGGEPLLHGGQIAECITVRAMALCMIPALKSAHRATSMPQLTEASQAFLWDSNRQLLSVFDLPKPPSGSPALGLPLPGLVPAFAEP